MDTRFQSGHPPDGSSLQWSHDLSAMDTSLTGTSSSTCRLGNGAILSAMDTGIDDSHTIDVELLQWSHDLSAMDTATPPG